MIAAVIILAGVIAVLAAVVGVLIREHQRERERWETERLRLVNRAIARHSGEVIAFDRSDAKRERSPEREPAQLIEGMN